MDKKQVEFEIAELKMDYARQQGDIEKLETNGHADMVDIAENRLANMEQQLKELNQKLAEF